MPERYIIPVVVLMMALALLFAFDNYYSAGGAEPTGFVVNSVQGVGCSDSDGNDPAVVGITSSSAYAGGYSADTCVGDSLLEFYCSESGPDVRAVDCFFGCYAGACN